MQGEMSVIGGNCDSVPADEGLVELDPRDAPVIWEVTSKSRLAATSWVSGRRCRTANSRLPIRRFRLETGTRVPPVCGSTVMHFGVC